MKYVINKQIFNLFPNYSRAVIVVSNINNNIKSDELFADFKNVIAKNLVRSIGVEKIKIWKDVYKSFPTKSSDIRPSIESLLKRVLKGDGDKIPFISPLVCISNLISLKYLLPSGLIDIQKVSGNLCLGYAKGDEIFYPFGKDEFTNPLLGEVIYYDDKTNNVMCGAWNSKGGKTTMVTNLTENAVIDIDAMLDVCTENEHQNAVNEMIGLIGKYCPCNINFFYLNSKNSEQEF